MLQENQSDERLWMMKLISLKEIIRGIQSLKSIKNHRLEISVQEKVEGE